MLGAICANVPIDAPPLYPRVQKGITVEQMEEFLMSIKIERELSDALKLAHANSTTVRILSVPNQLAKNQCMPASRAVENSVRAC